MKNNKLTLEKFRVAKLNNPKTIFGGNAGGVTNTEDCTRKTAVTTIIIRD